MPITQSEQQDLSHLWFGVVQPGSPRALANFLEPHGWQRLGTTLGNRTYWLNSDTDLLCLGYEWSGDYRVHFSSAVDHLLLVLRAILMNRGEYDFDDLALMEKAKVWAAQLGWQPADEAQQAA